MISVNVLMMSMISNDSTGYCSEGYWKAYGGFISTDCNYCSEVNSAGSNIFPAGAPNNGGQTSLSCLLKKKETTVKKGQSTNLHSTI